MGRVAANRVDLLADFGTDRVRGSSISRGLIRGPVLCRERERGVRAQLASLERGVDRLHPQFDPPEAIGAAVQIVLGPVDIVQDVDD